MRRILLGTWLATLPAIPGLQAQDTVTVGVGGQLSAPLGDRLLVPVFADMARAGGSRLGSYTVRVTWNPAVLSFAQVRPGAFAVPVVRTDSAYAGVLRASGISAAGLDGVFSLFDLEVSVVSPVADTVRVQVSELSAAGTFTDLLASAVVLTPGAPFCGALGRWGDLDGDEAANSRDALAVLSNVVGLPVGPFNLALGDVDGDGLTNSRDALILLSYAVGLEIPGQRVLLVAAGACGGSVPQFVILPDTADLVVDQSTPLRVFARDDSGRLTALDNLTWEVADGRVAAVDLNGLLTGRSPGTTTVTVAIGPGSRIAATVITRQRRGTWYVDAQRATQASVQMGTQRWPFATPEYTFPLAAEGDTVRVAPGAVDFTGTTCYAVCLDDNGYLHAGVVVIGDTLTDGTRPLLRARPSDYLPGFAWDGGVHAELRNLVMHGFQYHAYLSGLRTLLLDNVVIQGTPAYGGYGVYAARIYDSLVVRRSAFLGDSAQPAGYAVYAPEAARYVEVRNTQVRHWSSALWLNDVDSLDVEQSQFVENGDGIYLYHSRSGGVGARISRSRFESTGGAVYITGARGVALDHNYVLARGYGDPLFLSTSQALDGPAFLGSPGVTPAPAQVAGTKLTMQGDTVRFRASGYEWAYAAGWDSVLVDSLYLDNPADTALYQYGYIEANFARFSDSRFLNLTQEAIDFYGRELVVDNSTFTGCAVAGCAVTATAIRASSNDSGPAVRLTNSDFTNMYAALVSPQYTYRAGPKVITGNQVDSVSWAFDIYADSVVFADNVLTRVITRGLRSQVSHTEPPFYTVAALRNQITCLGGGYGIEASQAPVRADSNTILNCAYGLYGTGGAGYPVATFAARGNVIQPPTAAGGAGIWIDGRRRPALHGNRITGGYYGIYLVTTDTGAVVLDSNAVSATSTYGVYLSGISGPVTGRWNNISNNLTYGLYNYNVGTPLRSFTAGIFVGNGVNAIYNYPGSSTVVAQSNWWGDPLGPPASGPNSNSGSVDASSPLDVPPGDVPPLSAPRFAGAAAAGASEPVHSTVEVAVPPAAAREHPRVRHREHDALRMAREAERRARAEATSIVRTRPSPPR